MEDVYIARAGAQSQDRNTANKIKALCMAAGLENMVNRGDLTAGQGPLRRTGETTRS